MRHARERKDETRVVDTVTIADIQRFQTRRSDVSVGSGDADASGEVELLKMHAVIENVRHVAVGHPSRVSQHQRRQARERQQRKYTGKSGRSVDNQAPYRRVTAPSDYRSQRRRGVLRKADLDLSPQRRSPSDFPQSATCLGERAAFPGRQPAEDLEEDVVVEVNEPDAVTPLLLSGRQTLTARHRDDRWRRRRSAGIVVERVIAEVDRVRHR